MNSDLRGVGSVGEVRNGSEVGGDVFGLGYFVLAAQSDAWRWDREKRREERGA